MDSSVPGIKDFNPGGWGTEFEFFITPGHVPFPSRQGDRNLTIFDVFGVSREPYKGVTFHSKMKFHLESRGDKNVFVLYGADIGDRVLRKLGESCIPIPDGVWVKMRVVETEDGRIFVWINGRLDPDLSGIIDPMPDRIGFAGDTGWGVYAGVNFAAPQSGKPTTPALRVMIDNVSLYRLRKN